MKQTLHSCQICLMTLEIIKNVSRILTRKATDFALWSQEIDALSISCTWFLKNRVQVNRARVMVSNEKHSIQSLPGPKIGYFCQIWQDWIDTPNTNGTCWSCASTCKISLIHSNLPIQTSYYDSMRCKHCCGRRSGLLVFHRRMHW